MSDTATLPKPIKRKSFTAREVAAVFIKSDGRCAHCREKVSLDGYAIDHIQALDHLGAHALENWQLLCKPCHIVKTKGDVKASAKSRRLRGETGNGPKRKIVSRGFDRPLLDSPAQCDPKRILSAGSKWPKRGFDKTRRRKFSGKVERVGQ